MNNSLFFFATDSQIIRRWFRENLWICGEFFYCIIRDYL